MHVAALIDQFCAAGATLRSDGGPPCAFEEFQASARTLSERLRRAGIRERDLVAVATPDALTLLRATFALWQVGAVPCPMDGTERAPPAAAAILQPGEQIELTDGTRTRMTVGTALVHKTSGSSGAARLVRRSAATLHGEALRYVATLGLGPGDRVLLPARIHHSYGWGMLMGALKAGASIDLRSGFSPRRIAREIDRGGASLVAIVPAMAKLLSGVPGRCAAVPHPVVMVGAGPVTARLEESFERRFGVGLARNYGCTETGATFFGKAGLPDRCVGWPMVGLQVEQPAPGCTGELLVQLDHPVDGYLDGPVLSPSWATGDLARRSPDGSVTILDRTSERLRPNGIPVDRAEVEEVILGAQGVEDVFLLTRPRQASPGVEELVAVVAGSVNVSSLRIRCRDLLPGPARPSVFVTVRHLPRTPAGKLDRASLERTLRDRP